MSLRLVLMRHAKSSWKSGVASDHARPLNGRGRRDAPRIAAALRDRGWWPDVALVSDARRTLETWERMATEGAAVVLRTERRLYLAGLAELEEVLGEHSSAGPTVLVLGHNPGWEEVLAWLTGAERRMTTGNAALLSTDAQSWSEALGAPGRFRLLELLQPRALPSTSAPGGRA